MEKFQTLFLDRDGVINEERPDDYIKNINEFIFLPRVLEAIRQLSKRFKYIFIVTNQRGVGRGIMTNLDLQNIHQMMLEKIRESGGRIDNIYVCTDTESESPDRKPNIGMALKAKQNYPDINFGTSIMVGNSLSDMKFGKNAGMTTVLVGNKYAKSEKNVSLIDYSFEDLYRFSTQSFIEII